MNMFNFLFGSSYVLIVEIPLKNHINHNTLVNKKSKTLSECSCFTYFLFISRLHCVAADDNIRQIFCLALSSWLLLLLSSSSSSLIKPCFNALFCWWIVGFKSKCWYISTALRLIRVRQFCWCSHFFSLSVCVHVCVFVFFYRIFICTVPFTVLSKTSILELLCKHEMGKKRLTHTHHHCA